MAEGWYRADQCAYFDGAAQASLGRSLRGFVCLHRLVPLIAPHSWEHHFGKVAAFWSFALIIPMVATCGIWTATTEILHVFLLDYLPFIILLFALFVVAGGIRVRGIWSARRPRTRQCSHSELCRQVFSERPAPRWCWFDRSSG